MSFRRLLSAPAFFPAGFACLLVTVLAAAAAEPAPSPPVPPPAKKVLFLGNSLTLHAPKPDIGWTGNWGMAATTREKDYVHLVTAGISSDSGAEPVTMIRNIADFERNYADYDAATALREVISFQADLVILAIGENVPALTDPESQSKYAAAFSRLLSALQHGGKPAVFVRSSFWPDERKDGIMRQTTTAAGAHWVDISALGREEANAARSERSIEHAGVAAHPGDRGMRAIADAVLSVIRRTAATAPPASGP